VNLEGTIQEVELASIVSLEAIHLSRQSKTFLFNSRFSGVHS